MEQRTARAFKEQGIEQSHKWTTKPESKDEGCARKLRNSSKLRVLKHRKYRNPEHEELKQKLHQADAERRRDYRNPQDEEVSLQRHRDHAQRQRQFRNPEDEELSQQRHREHAERQHQFRNPEDKEELG